jgi:hypothetical protein
MNEELLVIDRSVKNRNGWAAWAADRVSLQDSTAKFAKDAKKSAAQRGPICALGSLGGHFQRQMAPSCAGRIQPRTTRTNANGAAATPGQDLENKPGVKPHVRVGSCCSWFNSSLA